MQIRRVLAHVACRSAIAVYLGLAAVLLVSAGPVAAQRDQNNRQQPAAMPADPDTVTLVRLVDAVSMGQQPAPSDIAVNWDANHFVKGQGGITYIPFTLSIDRAALPAPAAALYIRVVDMTQAAAPAPPAPPANNAKNQPPPAAPRYAWDNINFIDVPTDGKVSRAIALQPGEYEAFIAVKERSAPVDPKAKPAQGAAPAATGKMTVYRRDLSVPNFNSTDLSTSSVILAAAVEPIAQQLSPAEQEANPYVFGPMRIVPVRDGRFSKAGELNVVFWIYGAGSAANGKPDVTVEYNFHQRLAEGEKYFNKTAPQDLNAQTLPPEFSVAAGHQLPGSLAVALTPFPVGDYRLEIKVTDKVTSKVITQNVNFTVLPV
jgi:hypothetical protein